MDKHELDLVYVNNGRYIGEKDREGQNIYIGDYYVCSCGEKFRVIGEVLAAFEHGQRTAR